MKSLILWFCRVLAAVLIVSGFAYFLGNLDSFDSLSEKELNVREQLDALHLKKETDKNATSAEISALLRLRSAYRREKEELEDNSIGDREEMNALERKFSKENENFKEVEQKLTYQTEELEKLNAEIDREQQAQQPLISQKENLSKELETEIGISNQKRIEMEEINAEINKMKLTRKAAASSYKVSYDSIVDEIVLPDCLFFGDQLEVAVESISPSGHGFFIKQGARDGIRTDFFFLASLGSLGESFPFFLKATLVEEGYSFLEAENDSLNLRDLVMPEQNLFLIRTGESDKKDESEIDVDVALESNPL